MMCGSWRWALAALVLWACGGRVGWASDEISVYDVGSSWTAQDGRTVRWPELGGKPRVVAMFFSHCAYACPRITADLKRIEAALPEDLRDGVGFVLVSFDARRDDPATLRAFADRMGLPPARWTLLHGSSDDIRELAAVLGVRYRAEGEDFAHANLITLLDARGRIVAQREGLESPLDDLIAHLRNLLRPPSVD